MVTTCGVKKICVNYWTGELVFVLSAALTIVSQIKDEKLLNTWMELFSANLLNKYENKVALSAAHLEDSKVSTLSKNSPTERDSIWEINLYTFWSVKRYYIIFENKTKYYLIGLFIKQRSKNFTYISCEDVVDLLVKVFYKLVDQWWDLHFVDFLYFNDLLDLLYWALLLLLLSLGGLLLFLLWILCSALLFRATSRG